MGVHCNEIFGQSAELIAAPGAGPKLVIAQIPGENRIKTAPKRQKQQGFEESLKERKASQAKAKES